MYHKNVQATVLVFRAVKPPTLLQPSGIAECSNLKVQRDYYTAIEVVMQRCYTGDRDGQLLSEKQNVADNHMLYLQGKGSVTDTKNESEENWM